MYSLYEDHNHYRTIWDITLSCVVTVLTCSWLAIHPNTSYPIDKQQLNTWKKYLYATRVLLYERLSIIALLLIFPEFVLAWAIKQYLVARNMSKAPGIYIH